MSATKRAAAKDKSYTIKINELSVIEEGGEGTKLMMDEREKPGFLWFKNSYWVITLFSLRGRAVPWVPLGIYLSYAALVCGIMMALRGSTMDERLRQLNSVTTTIGVALFLLLSFRNNAAFTRWQTGTDRFKNFCHLGKNTARVITGNLSSYIAVGGREVAFDLVLERLNWLMAGMEMGRQHLRGEQNEEHLLDLVSPEEVEKLHADRDPVLYCMYKVLDMERKYVVNKCNEWMRGCDQMYLEFCACINVYSTPIPFAYISHLRTFLVLWLACVPWVYVIYYQWYTLIVCFVIGYGIIGVEEAAVEVEQPFGRDFNDIPLDAIVADSYGAIGTYIRIVREAKAADLAAREAEAAAAEAAAAAGGDAKGAGGGQGSGKEGGKDAGEKDAAKSGGGGKDAGAGKGGDQGGRPAVGEVRAKVQELESRPGGGAPAPAAPAAVAAAAPAAPAAAAAAAPAAAVAAAPASSGGAAGGEPGVAIVEIVKRGGGGGGGGESGGENGRERGAPPKRAATDKRQEGERGAKGEKTDKPEEQGAGAAVGAAADFMDDAGD